MNMRTSGSEWLARADVVLVIDAAVPWVPRRFKPREDAVVVQMSADPTYAMYPYRDFPADRLLACSTRAGLGKLATSLDEADFADDAVERRRQHIRGLVEQSNDRRRARKAAARKRSPIDAAWIADCINEVSSDDAVVVNELGMPFEHLEFGDDSIYVGETTAGGLGTGLGAALGAKVAAPERDVICCIGDGSFMFGNPTPALLVSGAAGIPVTAIVANNGSGLPSSKARWIFIRMAPLRRRRKRHYPISVRAPTTRRLPQRVVPTAARSANRPS